MYYTPAFRKRLHPQGSSSPCLGEPRGPQERIQQRTMEQLADVVPTVQILDIPVPQLVEQLADIMRFFDTLLPVPEQVIEVPKILLDDVPVRVTQLAEQLLEVPTIVSYSSLQRTMEQHVDIPVPGRGGRISGLQGFPPGQCPTALHVSQELISERIVEQFVDIPGGGLQDFRPGQSSSSSSHFPAGVHEVMNELGEGFFHTFPRKKKSARVAGQVGAQLGGHVSPSTLSAGAVP